MAKANPILLYVKLILLGLNCMIFSQQEGLVSHDTFSVLVDDTHSQTPSVLVMIYEENIKDTFTVGETEVLQAGSTQSTPSNDHNSFVEKKTKEILTEKSRSYITSST